MKSLIILTNISSLMIMIILLLISYSSCSILHPLIKDSQAQHQNFTAISDFRVVNRRELRDCPNLNPFLDIKAVISSGINNANNNNNNNNKLGDEEYVTVTVSGVFFPSKLHWIAMISPSHSNVESCPLNKAYYVQTGDFSNLPLLCHYPVKAAFLSNDPDYLSCNKKECKSYKGGKCEVMTCTASVSFHVINIRTDIQFVFFSGGFNSPCIIAKSTPLTFSSPSRPLYGHLASIDSSATSMIVTWVSGDNKPQQVQYGDGKLQISQVTTFTQNDMCSSSVLISPAKDFGWHDPGFIHSAVMTNLKPSTTFTYRYGSDSVGWSDKIEFKTPPAGGSDEVKFLAFGDMGKAPRDNSVEHYIQPGSISVVQAMEEEIKSRNVDSIFHIGDISYATGFLVEWDYFLHLINPVASRIPYMTAIGNHERDYLESGSKYITPDSGGECGVPYETYFQMPIQTKDKPWYSIEKGPVHFTIISTEHDWSINSDQYNWMKNDMASVDRSKTPWLIFMGHRPMYTSTPGFFSTDPMFINQVEPLLVANKVDLALFGHVHNYERGCSMYRHQCLSMPRKVNGTDTYDHNNYKAPIHAVIGMAGFVLDNFPLMVNNSWSLARISEFGYFRGHGTKEELKLEFVNAITKNVQDSFRIIKKQDQSNRKITIGQ